MGQKEDAIVEIKRLLKEMKMFSADTDFNSIYDLCESIMVTIEEADLF